LNKIAEEIVAIKIIGSNMSGITGGSSPSSGGAGGISSTKGMVSGMGGMLKGLMGSLGIASGIGLVVMIVGQFKALLNIVGQIIKMVAMVLKPIADVVMILLMPILMILKPIVQIANQVMAPFIKLSMQLMREGMTRLSNGDSTGTGAMLSGAMVGIQGLNSVIVALLGGVIKMAISLTFDMLKNGIVVLVGALGTLIAPIAEWFVGDISGTITGIQEKIKLGMDAAKEGTLLGIDILYGNVLAGFGAQTAMLAETFGVDTKKFGKKAAENIEKLFGKSGLGGTWEEKIGVGAGLGKIAKDSLDKLFKEDEGLTKALTDGIVTFKSEGEKAIGGAIESFNSLWDQLHGPSSSKDNDNNMIYTVENGTLNVLGVPTVPY